MPLLAPHFKHVSELKKLSPAFDYDRTPAPPSVCPVATSPGALAAYARAMPHRTDLWFSAAPLGKGNWSTTIDRLAAGEVGC